MNNKLILRSFILFTLFFVGTLNLATRDSLIDRQSETVVLDQTNDETNQNKEKLIRIAKRLGSGLNSASMPFRRGIGKGVENFTSKVTGKAIPLVFGCAAYWLLHGRQNDQSILLPVTSAFKILKKLFWQNESEVRMDSSIRRFDTAMKISWNWVLNQFGKGTDNLVLDPITNRASSMPNLQDRAIAITFLLLANYLF